MQERGLYAAVVASLLFVAGRVAEETEGDDRDSDSRRCILVLKNCAVDDCCVSITFDNGEETT